MNTFYKFACLLVGLVFCALFYTGCAPSTVNHTEASPPPAPASEAAPAAPPTLSGTLTVYLEKPYTEDYPVWRALRQFEAENPQLTVEYITPPIGDDPDGVREAAITRLETEIMAGGGPIFICSAGVAPTSSFSPICKNPCAAALFWTSNRCWPPTAPMWTARTFGRG